MITRRISRFNHSCAPNCEALFDNLANIRVYVKEDIKSGEEMTINYLPLDWESDGASPAQERRKILKEDWGFDCMYKRCMRETSGEGSAADAE